MTKKKRLGKRFVNLLSLKTIFKKNRELKGKLSNMKNDLKKFKNSCETVPPLWRFSAISEGFTVIVPLPMRLLTKG
jgi:hypothetical protein